MAQHRPHSFRDLDKLVERVAPEGTAKRPKPSAKQAAKDRRIDPYELNQSLFERAWRKERD